MEQRRYINPLTDYGFKKIFGDEEVMMDFLNDLMQLPSPIASLTFIDKEMLAESLQDKHRLLVI